MERLVFIFFDGCGVGSPAGDNPFPLADSRNLPFWRGAMALADGTPVKAIAGGLGRGLAKKVFLRTMRPCPWQGPGLRRHGQF